MSTKEHHVDADFNPDDETVRKLTRAIGQLIEKPPSNNYYNGGGDKRALNWILGMLGTLIVSGIIGGVAMYGKLTAIEMGMNGHEQRIDRLERVNENRYRGATSSSP